MKTIARGIDISQWQGDFNLQQAVAEDFTFVIIKGGGSDDGTYIDSQFVSNYTKAKRLGIPVGAYWFSKALSIDQAKQEAEYMYTHVLKGRQFELPIYIDIEDQTMLNLGKRLVTDMIKAWCDTLERKKFYVGIYASLYHFSDFMYDNELTRYTHWVAQWAKTCTYENEDCLGMWQYGGGTNLIRSNIVAGVVCDQDYMLKDFPPIIKAAGYNGFQDTTEPPKPDPSQKTIDEIAREVIAGEWGNGDERKKRLAEAGYDASAVQNRVNELLGDSPNKSIDEIAREVIAGEWGDGDERKKRLTEAGYDVNAVQKRVNELMQ